MTKEQLRIHVGIDVSKDKLAVAIAGGGVRDEVLSLGTFGNTPASVDRLLKKLSGRGLPVSVCYEAGPTGYGLYRQVRAFGFECCVVAPSLIPVRAGDRVKTDRLDAIRLARLFRAGELTPIWVPDETHEAMRDLVRARESAAEDQRHKRQLVSAFMLRHGRIYHRTKPWTMRYRRWLQSQIFDHPAHQIALQEMLQAERNATERHDRLTGHIEALVPEWDLAPAVNALQALRGVALISAVTFMAEIGDVRRFESPVKLMAYLGLVPSEYSFRCTCANVWFRRFCEPSGWFAHDLHTFTAYDPDLGSRSLYKTYIARHTVSVRCDRSDDGGLLSIMSMIDNGHLEALDGGQERAEEAVLV